MKLKTTKIKNTACLVAGKSAGHILPAITIGQKLKIQDPTLKITFISNKTALDYQTIANNPIINEHLAVNLMAIPTRKFWLLPKFGWQLVRACLQTLLFLKKNRPKQVISTGGLIAVPVCLMAKLLKIPVTIYELNVTPGKATKFLAKLANEIKICFQQTANYLPQSKCQITQYPTRFNKSDYEISKAQALDLVKQKSTDLNLNRKTILILGGSQGSLFINQIIYKFIKQLTNQITNQALSLQIIHQTGHNDVTNWPNFYLENQIPAIVFTYESNLMPYYKLADLIICRSGAGTLAEILPLKTNCITIPLETSYTNHQLENAQALAQSYPWIKVLTQAQLTQDLSKFTDLVLFMALKS